MKHYINKDALVAEIEKLQLCTMDEHMNFYSAEAQGEYNAFSKLESFIDTLEVKEMDLDDDFGVYWGEYCDCDGNINDYEVAKHFFELGLKAQKGK